MSLASVSLVYSVVAIYFLIPAEKLLRKFFGFDKSGTLSAAGSFAGGALFSAMINKMNRPKPGNEKEKDDKPKVRKPSSGNRVGSDALQVDMSGAPGGAGGTGGAGRSWWRGWCWTELVALGASRWSRSDMDHGSTRNWSKWESEDLVINFLVELATML